MGIFELALNASSQARTCTLVLMQHPLRDKNTHYKHIRTQSHMGTCSLIETRPMYWISLLASKSWPICQYLWDARLDHFHCLSLKSQKLYRWPWPLLRYSLRNRTDTLFECTCGYIHVLCSILHVNYSWCLLLCRWLAQGIQVSCQIQLKWTETQWTLQEGISSYNYTAHTGKQSFDDKRLNLQNKTKYPRNVTIKLGVNLT